MRSDLEAVKRTIAPKSSLRVAILAAVALVVILVVGATFWFTRHQSGQTRTFPDVKLTQLTANAPENQVTGGSISPNGKLLAYTDDQGVHVKAIGADESQTLALPKTDAKLAWQTVAWFPDNDKFVVNSHAASKNSTEWSSADSTIWLFSTRGDAPRKLRDNGFASSVSPDGKLIAFSAGKSSWGDSELWVMPPNGEARKLYESQQGLCCLTFFPDSKRVGYIVQTGSGEVAISRELKSGPPSVWVPASEWKQMGDGTFLPDGRWLYSDPCTNKERTDASWNYWVERRDPRTGKIIEPPRRITNLFGFCMFGPSSSADGKRLAFLRMSNRNASHVADLQAGGTRLANSRRVTLEEGGEDAAIDWTADGKSLILIHNRMDHYTLLKQAIDTDTPAPITTSQKSLLENAIVSPDQMWVIIQVYPVGSEDNFQTTVKVMRVAIAGGTPELIFSMRNGSTISCAKYLSNLCVVAEESSDRKSMIVNSFDPIKGRGSEIMRFDLGHYAKTGLSIGNRSLLCDISADGTRLAIVRGSSAPVEIYSLRGKRLGMTPPLGDVSQIYWAADRNGLFVSRHLNDGTELVHVALNGSTHSLWKSHGESCFGRPSPDGRHIAIFDSQETVNMWMMENF
jgi:Tol biopolymer transport system component